jgi:DNA-directed RNA polymerase subunit M/transcription elongation factor TFIIS
MKNPLELNHCQRCHSRMTPKRKKSRQVKYCSNACKQAKYRENKAARELAAIKKAKKGKQQDKTKGRFVLRVG